MCDVGEVGMIRLNGKPISLGVWRCRGDFDIWFSACRTVTFLDYWKRNDVQAKIRKKLDLS